MSPLPNGRWQQRTDAQPLRAWRDEQLSTVAATIGEVVRCWATEWDLTGFNRLPSCQAAAGAAAHDWACLGDDGNTGAWISWHDASSLGRALFGEEIDGAPVAAEVTQACRHDVQQRLASALLRNVRPATARRGPPDASPWSGAVQLMLPCEASLLLEAQVVQRLAARSEPPASRAVGRDPPLASLATALAPVALPLQVALEGCELGLAELQGLKPGDVLRLGHRVQAPADVRDLAGRVLFSGWLAASRGHLAVELARRSA